MNRDPDILGRKVFFLHPHSVIQNDMIDILINHEYEVYIINDNEKMLKLAEIFPEAILFINIDEKLSEEEWEAYVRNILKNKNLISRIGILTYNKDKNLAQKYLMNIMVPCGFIILSLGLEQSASTILKMLHVNEAKGRRKFLRSACVNDNTKFNLKLNNNIYTGSIIDISIVGMAVVFDIDINIELKTFIDDIQLQLKGIICRTQGIVIAYRDNNKGGYVIMFNKTDEGTRKKIHNFIYNQLQMDMQTTINSIR